MSNATENQKTYFKREQRFSVEDLKQLQVVIMRAGEGETKEYSADLVDISRRGLKFHVPICVGFAEEVEIRIETMQLEVIYEGQCTARHIRSISDNCWEVGCSLDPHLPEEVIDFVVGVSGKERRANPRIPISHNAELKRQGQVHGADVELKNISLGGFCLAVKEEHEVGERVKLQVVDPDSKEHTIAARIRWQNETDDGYLVGCSFVESNSHLVLLSCLHETQSEEGLNWYVIAAAMFAMFLPPVVSLFVSSDGQAEQKRSRSAEVVSELEGTATPSIKPQIEIDLPADPKASTEPESNVESTPDDLGLENAPSDDPVDPIRSGMPVAHVAEKPTPSSSPTDPTPSVTHQPVLAPKSIDELRSNGPSVLVKRPERASDVIAEENSSIRRFKKPIPEVNRPFVSTLKVDSSEANPPRAERRKVDPPKVDPPKVDPPKVDPPKVDPPKVDPPKVDPPKVDPPKVDPPKVDPPKADPPKADPPKVDPPKVDPPKVDPPKVDPPKVDPPKADPPKVDPPKVDPPKVDPPKVDPPKVDPPKVDPPKVDPPKADPPKVDPPKVDPPKVDPPKVEDPNLRVWRHHRGLKTIKAVLKEVDGDRVVLFDENGKEHVLPYDWFSINDLIHLGEVGEK